MSELQHYGVKGMQWGVRNDSGHQGESASPRKINKLDRKFEKKAGSNKVYFDILNKAADDFNNNKLNPINNKPRWQKAANSGVLLDHYHPTTRAYNKEINKAWIDSLDSVANARGTNASGTKRLSIKNFDAYNSDTWQLMLEDVKHADSELEFKIERSGTGMIIAIELIEPLSHDSSFEETLQHYGVKGMRWGRRKAEDSGNPEVQVDRTTKLSPSKIKTRKGGDLPASDDAVKAAAYKQAAKKSGPNALSNQQLQALVTRMNLEKQYSTLNPTKSKATKKFVADFMLGVGKQQMAKVANDQAGKAIASVIAAAAAKAAAKKMLAIGP